MGFFSERNGFLLHERKGFRSPREMGFFSGRKGFVFREKKGFFSEKRLSFITEKGFFYEKRVSLTRKKFFTRAQSDSNINGINAFFCCCCENLIRTSLRNRSQGRKYCVCFSGGFDL